MNRWHDRPTLDELLSDPMMDAVYDHDRNTADDVRSMMREAATKLAAGKAGDAGGDADDHG